jgi:hypothetical protein
LCIVSVEMNWLYFLNACVGQDCASTWFVIDRLATFK